MRQRIFLLALSSMMSLPLHGNDEDKKKEKKSLARKNYQAAGSINSTAYSRFLYEPISTKRDKKILDNRKRYGVTTVPQYRIKVKTLPSKSYRDRNHKLNRRR